MKVLYEFKIKSKYLELFVEAFSKLKEAVKKNETCLLYEYLVTEESVFILEEWRSEDDLTEHRASSELRSFRKKINLYLKSPRDEYFLIKR